MTTESTSADAPWKRLHFADGVATYRLSTWALFATFLDSQVFTNRGRAEHQFIWRGQRCADWGLTSSLDRLFERVKYRVPGNTTLEQRAQEHLENFKYAARGRRGLNPPQNLLENEWWALGQHFGLATPLLDWSHSPFAAAYFAFEEHRTETSHRVVFGLDRDAVQSANRRIDDEGPADQITNVTGAGEALQTERKVLELIDPLSDENPRLVNQGALFTRAPINTSVEAWVQSVFEGAQHEVLLRIEIPDTDRTQCLRALDRMNINHLSLFPDLTGASRATNLRTEIDLLQ
jgi:FRG domain